MSRFKEFQHPSWQEYQEKINENPIETPRYLVEYYYNCLAIDEINEIRSKATNKSAYSSQSKHAHKKYHTMEGIITLKYPYLRNGTKPKKTMKQLELLEKKWKQSIESRYISGESLRDLSREVTENGNPYCPMSISRIVDEEEGKRVESSKGKDLGGRDYVDIQLDATFDKVRMEDSPTAAYKTLPLIRIIGLEQQSLEWEFLYEGVYSAESSLSYQMSLDELIEMNPGEIYLATADMHASIRSTVLTTLIGIEYQACRFHIQKATSMKDVKNSEAIEKAFHYIYDKSTIREEAYRYYSMFKTGLLQFKEPVYKTLDKYFVDSLPFLDYPSNLSKQISNSNKIERSNQSIRRRTDAIYSNASKESFVDLADCVTEIYTEKWSDQPKGNALTASLCKIVHNSFIVPLTTKIDQALEEDIYDRYRRTGLAWKQSVAFRINIWALPFKIEDRIISGGLLTVHGIDKNKKEHLVHVEQIRHLTQSEVTYAMNSMLERGLKTERIQMVIFNRPYHFLIEGVKQIFPEAGVFIDASYISERLLFLVPDSLKENIQSLLDSVYQAKTVQKAYESLHQLKQRLRELNLRYPLEWLGKFKEEELISIFEMVERGVWKDYKIEDFEVFNSWKERIKQISLAPDTVENTIKAFITTLKKRKNKGNS